MGKNNGLKWGGDRYWESASYNTRLYSMLRNQVNDMVLTRYHWVNLPNTCDERYLELTLFNQGMATIAYERSKPHVWRSLQVGGWQKTPDMYGNPRIWNALGMNGYQFNVNRHNGYFVWDNHLRVPAYDRIEIWVRELVDIIRTMQQNRMHQKVPVVITGLQNKRLDMTNYLKQIGGGEVAVLADKEFARDVEVKALKTDLPFIGNELWQNYLNIWTQIYGAFGIGNLPFKAERQIEDEVNSQSDPTDLNALDGLTCRREMCDYLNQHFTDFAEKPLSVVWRSDNATSNFDLTHNLKMALSLTDGDENNDDVA